VDEKGRLKLPAEYKHFADERYGSPRYFITSEDGRTARVYPMEEWEGIEKKLAAMPNSSPAKQKYLDRAAYYGGTAEFDGQGRLLLPQTLREKADLLGDVVVVGKMTYLEVTKLDRFVADMEARPVTPEDRAEWAEFGL
jgi:MraZ protein